METLSTTTSEETWKEEKGKRKKIEEQSILSEINSILMIIMKTKISSIGIWCVLFVFLLTACETNRGMMYGNQVSDLGNSVTIFFSLAIGFLIGFLFAKRRRRRTIR